MSRRNPSYDEPDPADRPGPRRATLEDEYEERLPRAGERGRRPPGGGSTANTARIPSGCLLVVALGLLLFILGPVLLDLSVDWQWFGSLGLQSVFGTRIGAAFEVFLAGFVVAAVFLAANWLLARRVAAPRRLFPGQQLSVPAGLLSAAIGMAVALAALILAFSAGGAWSTVLSFFNHTAFGASDPIFNQDIGFYVFELPFYEFLRGWALGLIVVTAVGAAVIYGTRPSLLVSGQRFTPDPRVVGHFTFLGVCFLLLMAVGYWFNTYDLLFAEHSALHGASYTDVNARLLAYRILMVITVLTAVVLLATLRLRTLLPLAGAVGLWILVQVLVGGLYPGFVQNFTVRPDEQNKERPYIENNIAATRAAFGLDKFQEHQVSDTRLARADVEANRDLVNSIRLWDYRPLRDTYNQLQSLRPYYTFTGVDIDRYPLSGGERQVMIAARELNVDGLQPQARTWLNQHLVYTHGYGVVASPVNRIEEAGQPHFLVRNLPPASEDPTLAITRPQIYYGEAEDNYVIVHTGAEEFDYPAGERDVTASYAGTGGVLLGNFLNRLQFAAYFGDFTMLISDLVHDDSRMLFHRDFGEAVARVAPFLGYDSDPYIVVADGKLYWIQDAFTLTDRYPNSTPYQPDPTVASYVRMNFDSVNYIRNSVKVVVDAYNGTLDFYVVDDKDPLIATYRRIFPTLFKDGATMPAGLQAHLRYPESMFNAQAIMYDTYHMTDPQVFYNRGDAWKVPFGGQTESAAGLEAYYTMMRLPEEQRIQFMLMVPFTPLSKPNMIAWMAARYGTVADGGRVDLIRFPYNTTVYGPQQIDATINQDPVISSQMTLWNASGSKVLRGNLLVIPIGTSVLYVQPLFLQATTNPLPELKRVIAGSGGQVGWGEDLESALNAMFGARTQPPSIPGPILPGATPLPGSTPGGGGPTPAVACTGDVRSTSAAALDHYQRAQEALKAGDWASYGSEQAQVEAALHCLEQLTR